MISKLLTCLCSGQMQFQELINPYIWQRLFCDADYYIQPAY
ncbi:Uncharacterised protein [Klebsiella pneumoniae]|nr:Uncharacterised protein [Klebsiella pneumoniae]